MDYDVSGALNTVFSVVRVHSLKSGINALTEYCFKHQAGEFVEAKINRIKYLADAKLVQNQIRKIFISGQIPPSYTGLYFGLDSLNAPDGKGIEFGCSRTCDPNSKDVGWAYDCDLYFSEFKSDAITKLYRIIPNNSLADYVLGLGYLGLALKESFTAISKILPQLKQTPRAICWGFHDGDLFKLGVCEVNGFRLSVPKTQVFQSALKQIARKREKNSGYIHWIQIAEKNAYDAKDVITRAELLVSVAAQYCKAGKLAAAEQLLGDLLELNNKTEVSEVPIVQMELDSIADVYRQQRRQFPPALLSLYSSALQQIKPSNEEILATDILDKCFVQIKVNASVHPRMLEDARRAVEATRGIASSNVRGALDRRMFNLYKDAGCFKKARQYALDNDCLYSEIDWAEIHYLAGDKKEYQKSLRFHLRRNAKFSGVCDVAELQFKLKDFKAFQKSVTKAKNIQVSLTSMFEKILANNRFATLMFRCGDVPAASHYVIQSQKWAMQSKLSDVDDKIRIWSDLMETFCEFRMFAEALSCAKRIPKKESRLKNCGTILLDLGREKDAEQLIGEFKSPRGKVEFTQWIATHLLQKAHRTHE